MAEVLIVKRPFGDYARGDVITDEDEIKAHKGRENAVSRRIDLEKRHGVKPAEPAIEHADTPAAAEEG